MIKIDFEKQNDEYVIVDYVVPDVTDVQKAKGCIHKAVRKFGTAIQNGMEVAYELATPEPIEGHINIGGLIVTRGSKVSIQIYDSIRQRVELSNGILGG